MVLAAHRVSVSAETYLALERAAEHRSEFIDGEIVAMAGASREHNIIAGNVFGELRNQLKGRPCEAYISDMRLGVDLSHYYTYPDVTVVCGEPEFLDDSHFDVLLNPTVLVEVLSPSTEDYDRGRKFARYRGLGTLTDYVLVAQDRMLVEHYARDGMRWSLTDHTEPEAAIDLPAIGCRLSLAGIYEKVVFKPAIEAAGAGADGPSPLPR